MRKVLEGIADAVLAVFIVILLLLYLILYPETGCSHADLDK